ncbi:Uncharacterised protein [BD1-7 clade bacterium]|uniref:Uncharacterized protein n=1 Tax=BD1-7 clade bacterium TaxID=2029982 RepID=A0A5S9N552_9GAMM|nr:Uncharacterised protein [BD1-7 clade bacterium]
MHSVIVGTTAIVSLSNANVSVVCLMINSKEWTNAQYSFYHVGTNAIFVYSAI